VTAKDLALAHTLADLAGNISAGHFRRAGLRAWRKRDGTAVTEVDVRIETELSSVLARRRPADSVWSEELRPRGGCSRRWLIDGIDGTASYLAGEPEWSTLIGLEVGGAVSLGVISAPALGKRWWATRRGGAWCRHRVAGHDEIIGLSVTTTRTLTAATVAIWPLPGLLRGDVRDGLARVASRAHRASPPARSTNAPGPAKPSTGTGVCHGALLVASGQRDAFILAGGGPWDVAAAVPIVEESGGLFSDLSGGRLLGGGAIFSNRTIHDQILNCIR
jgi:histidinol-phosphatase